MDRDKLREKAAKKISQIDIDFDNEMDIKKLIQELKIHQIELKQQNEEMQRYQAKLQESRDKYHLLFEKAPVGYFIFDQEGIILDLNSKSSRLLKTRKKMLINKPFMLYLPSDSQEKFHFHREQVFEQEGLQKCELRIKRKDGSYQTVWLESECLPGDETKIMTAMVNITEQKRAIEQLKINKKELKNSEKKINAITDSAQDAILMMGSRGKILYWNPAAEKIFGYEKKEVIGQHLHKLLAPQKYYKMFKDKFPRFKESGKGDAVGRTLELEALRQDGKKIDIELSLSSVQINDNWHAVGIVRDITDRKRTEKIMQARLDLISYSYNHSLNEVLQEALDKACDIVESQIGFYHFVDNDENDIKLQAWSTNTLKNYCNIREDKKHQNIPAAGIWADCIRQRGPLIINDYDSLAEHRKMPEDHPAVKRLLVVPVKRQDKIVSVLGVGNKELDYTEKDLEIVNYFADVAWEIVERKRSEMDLVSYNEQLEEQKKELEITKQRLDSEINKAKKLHEKTLPKVVPQVDGIDMYAYYQPESELGGDFYNLIKLDEKLLFYISDITGHGLDAAMMSSFLKTTINTYLNLLPPASAINPEKIIDFIKNQYFQENFPEDYFITILLGVVDCKENLLIYSSAGIQVAPVLYNKELIELPAGNLPISITIPDDKLIYKNIEVELSPDTILFFSTDGLEEQVSGDEVYGDRYKKIISKYNHLQPGEIAEKINKDFAGFNNDMVGDDDITYVLIKVN